MHSLTKPVITVLMLLGAASVTAETALDIDLPTRPVNSDELTLEVRYPGQHSVIKASRSNLFDLRTFIAGGIRPTNIDFQRGIPPAGEVHAVMLDVKTQIAGWYFLYIYIDAYQ